MKVVNRAARTIDYRLNILGVRVWENYCQLIAKSLHEWVTIGPSVELPVYIPHGTKELKTVAEDTLRLTAYQYDTERPGSDLVTVLGKGKDFSKALDVSSAAAPAE